MRFFAEAICPKEWSKVSEEAHFLTFDKHKPKEWDRIDFALLLKSGEGLHGYITCRELDAKTVYWQYGGAFPGTKNSSLSYPAYISGVEWCKSRYERIRTMVENDNFTYLKFCMKAGFKIVGIGFHANKVLLEHVLEFEQ